MKKMKLDYPETAEAAILAVCYLRAWTAKQLAHAMGLKDASNLSKIINHKEKGTEKMRDRVLEHMPDRFRRAMQRGE